MSISTMLASRDIVRHMVVADHVCYMIFQHIISPTYLWTCPLHCLQAVLCALVTQNDSVNETMPSIPIVGL